MWYVLFQSDINVPTFIRHFLDNLPTHIYHTTTVSTIYTLKSLNTLVALIDLFKNGLERL